MKRLIRLCLTASLLALFAVGMTACGDGNQEQDVTDDVVDVVESDVADAIDDVGVDADRDTADPDTTVCECSATDECCDGCAFINEGGNCELAGADIGFCQVTVCQSGVCVHGDRICEPDNKCAFVAGTCNPTDGACSFIEVMGKENGEVCEALAGIDGSGACLFGVCNPFPACDYRAYDQAAGMPCNYASECASGICRPYGYGWDHFCSQDCGGEVECPEGLRCVKDDTNAYFCERIGETFPGDASIALFGPCNADADCAGGLCLGYGETRFCTMDCEATAGGAADEALCGDCGDCVSGGIDKGFQYEFYCVTDSDGQPGDVCQSPMDCSKHFCFEGYCSDQCFIFSEELDSCPEGFKCILGAYDAELQTCVADTSLNKTLGDVCLHDYECVSGMCRQLGDEMICVDTCDDCANGSCQQIGWIETDTIVELWKDGSEETALTTDNDGGEGYLSLLSYYISENGLYFIHVEGDSDTITGPYVLSVAFDGGVELAVETDEVETNDDRATAEAKTVPFLINAQLEAAGHDWFKFSVTIPEGSTNIRLIAETIRLVDNACLPSTMVGVGDYGDACVWDWQCAEGFPCLEGMCNKTCTIDDDCPDGICFAYSDTDSRCVPNELIGQKEIQEPCTYTWECVGQCFADEYLYEVYCTDECETDDNCPWGMGCLAGICNKGFPTPNFPYGYCRMNADCESYICTEGMCTADCEADTDCEGSAAIIPEGPMALCATCATNADCNDGTEDFFNESYCVQVSETELFCTPQCTYDEGSCPEGTRCYSLDYATKVCAPVSFTCAAGGVGCVEEIEACVRPYIFDGEVCRYDGECMGGKCASGICRSETCDGTLECGCDLLECVDQYCVFTVAYDRELEVEPNNTVETAQWLMSIPVKVVGGFNAAGQAAIDTDLYKVMLVAGYAHNFVMSPACEIASDPAMLLRDKDGAYIDGYAFDDYGANYFPAIFGYVATANEFVYIEIVQSPWVDGILRQPYVLDVAIFMPAAGDNCVDATALNPWNDLPMGVTFEATTDSAIPPAVLGALAGPDTFRYFDLPARDAGTLFREWTALMTVDPQTSDFAVWAYTDCADVEGSLLTWSDFNTDEGNWNLSEALTIINDTDTVKRVYIGWNSLSWDSTTVSTIELIQNPGRDMPPTGESIATAVTIPENVGETYTYGQNLAYPWAADLTPTGGACEGLDVSGKDIVFKISVPPDTFIKAELARMYTSATILLLDGRDLTTCQKAGVGPLYYMPPVNEIDISMPNDVYIVVKGMGAHPGGMFRLVSTLMEVGDCAGPCDSETALASCVDGDNFCQCNATTGFWEATDCAASCIAGGYSVGGACHEFSTGSADGQSACLCEYDCAMPGLLDNMCDYGSYTNCTCDSSDPCAWIGDAYCDEFCTNEFENGFDDGADCTPVE